MDFNDFVVEFDDVYVCKQFTAEAGWHSAIIHDQWQGASAAGLPTRENRGCRFGNNPQYGISVTKAGPAFFVVRMKEKHNSYKAKHFGYYTVVAWGGEAAEVFDGPL